MNKKSKRTRFAVCINNTGYPASLEAGKLYRVVPDAEAEKHGLIRVVDASGEDYGYSSERFFELDVPHALERVLRQIPAVRQPNNAPKPASAATTSNAKRGGPRRSRVSM